MSTEMKVKVKTTLPFLPFPPNADRKPFYTPRLAMRPLTATDGPAVHRLRTQEAVMQWTMTGRIDSSLEKTEENMGRFLSPNEQENYNWAICLRDGDSPGEIIGLGGVHIFKGDHIGFPELGYMIRSEYWGKGLTSEFLKAFLSEWGKLPRQAQEIEVDRSCVKMKDDSVKGEIPNVPEILAAVTVETNGASRHLLTKYGFELFTKWMEDDLHDATGQTQVELFGYRKQFHDL